MMFLIVAAIFVLGTLVIRRIVIAPAVGRCPDGNCSTNIYTYERNCTDPVYDSIHVCNLNRECTAQETPLLLYDSDMGTAPPGTICPVDVPVENCRCVGQRFCPSDITTYFEPVQVSVFGVPDRAGQAVYRDYLVMTRTWRDSLAVPHWDTPLSPGNDGICEIGENRIDDLWPVELTERNNCIVGRLVYSAERETFRCINLDNMDCSVPGKRIIEERNAEGEMIYVCESL